jgi:hypothetical protein
MMSVHTKQKCNKSYTMIMEEHEEAKCALACIVYSSYDASE